MEPPVALVMGIAINTNDMIKTCSKYFLILYIMAWIVVFIWLAMSDSKYQDHLCW